MNRIVEEIASIATAIVGVAIVAVLVSKQSQTANAIKQAGTSFDSIISAAVKPVL